MPAAAYASFSMGRTVLKRHCRTTKPGKRKPRSCTTTPPRSPAAATHARVAQDVVDQRVQIARVRGGVVEAVGRQVGIAEAAQIGDDHLEAAGGERLDVALPDALRLRPAVHQEQRHAAAALAPVREVEQPANPRPLEPHG